MAEDPEPRNDDRLAAAGFACRPGIDRLTSGASFAVAVSGGPDSMALAWLLARQAQETGAVLHALTVDHGLRPGSAAEAAQVAQWLSAWPGMRHRILSLSLNSPPAADGEPPSGIMEAAREGRYAALAADCRAHGIRDLFLAHHLDDQAETFLFRLAKGSGLDGLSAMRPQQPYDSELTLWRSLLDVPKEHLIALCAEHSIPFVTDPTNANPRFARTRLRAAHEALAAEGLTPKRLGVTAARLGRARAALDAYARDLFARARLEGDGEALCLDYVLIAAQPAETRLRVLLLAMQELRSGDYNPRMERVEALADDLFDPHSGFKRRALGGLLIGRRRDGNIVIEKEAPPA